MRITALLLVLVIIAPTAFAGVPPESTQLKPDVKASEEAPTETSLSSNAEDNKAIEVQMPDGTKLHGFLKEGVFIPIETEKKTEPDSATRSADVESTPKPEIEVSYTAIPLKSRLKKKYAGYKVTITNHSEEQLELMNGEIVNGVNGQGAALGSQKSSAAAIGALLGTGLATGFFTLGITTLTSLVASPVVYAGYKHANNKVNGEGAHYGNQVSLGVIAPGETITVPALIPISQKPELKLTLRQTKNNELFTVSK